METIFLCLLSTGVATFYAHYEREDFACLIISLALEADRGHIGGIKSGCPTQGDDPNIPKAI